MDTAELLIPNLHRLSIAAERIANRVTKSLDLTVAQAMALTLMLDNEAEGGKPFMQRDLEYRMNISNPAATGLISRLEEKGLVERFKLDSDRRCNYLRLTPKGTKLRSEIGPVLRSSEDCLFEGFSDEERLRVISDIRRILKNAESVEPYPRIRIARRRA